MVEQPKVREIWAATFRHRVVHHVIYNRLHPRGSLDASNRLWSGIRSLTRNWKRPAFFLGADVRNFFVSIHKPTLYSLLTRKVYEPWLRDLTAQVLFHDPRRNCLLKSSRQGFGRVPAHKSLWQAPDERGLPIGNLTSQFFANIYLNELDQFVKRSLRAKYYYRYVDDFVILHESPAYLNECFALSEQFLREHLKLELHPYKKRLASLDQGVDFVGYFHKPFRRYLRRRTANRTKSVINQWRRNPKAFHSDALIRVRNSVNSYCGLMRHARHYRLRKHLGAQVNSLFVWPDEGYGKVLIH